MNNKLKLLLWLAVFLVALKVAPGTVAAETELEKFLMEFDGEYGLIKDRLNESPFDSKNPYVKSVKQVVTTENGVLVMLDKVLVTEDALIAAFLISGELPDNLTDVQLQVSSFDISPVLPYPEDSFKVVKGGGGGGGPMLLIANEDPLVLYHIVTKPLMYYDGYVSPADPMQVKIFVPLVSVGWRYQDEDLELESSDYYYEELNHTFEFETDGAELASLTKTYELNHRFKLGSHGYSFDKLRFNPMHLILFGSDSAETINYELNSPEDIRFVKAITDDGTAVILFPVYSPYWGFAKMILNPAQIQSLETTKQLTLSPCGYQKPLEEYESFPLMENESDFNCHPEASITLTVN